MRATACPGRRSATATCSPARTTRRFACGTSRAPRRPTRWGPPFALCTGGAWSRVGSWWQRLGRCRSWLVPASVLQGCCWCCHGRTSLQRLLSRCPSAGCCPNLAPTFHARCPLAALPPQTLSALHIFQGHLGVVEDVAWHPRHADLFGSVGWLGRARPLAAAACLEGSAGGRTCCAPCVVCTVAKAPACFWSAGPCRRAAPCCAPSPDHGACAAPLAAAAGGRRQEAGRLGPAQARGSCTGQGGGGALGWVWL